MPRFLPAGVLAAFFGVASAQLPLMPAKMPINAVCKNQLHAVVNNINNNNRDGVTRISCILTGKPHTSSRIDSCTLVMGGRSYGSADIDGVDFARYFQWEDDGRILVEIDFPRQAGFKPDDKIVFHTVGGDYSIHVGDKAKKQEGDERAH